MPENERIIIPCPLCMNIGNQVGCHFCGGSGEGVANIIYTTPPADKNVVLFPQQNRNNERRFPNNREGIIIPFSAHITP